LSRFQALALVVVAALVVGAIVVAVVASRGGDGGGGRAASKKKEVFAEPISTARNPFSPPVGTDYPSLPAVQTQGVSTQPGGQPGLYGGTMQQGSCDRTQLVVFLQQNPDKGAAWASTLGITPADIPTYVSGLTAVLLRSDTRVTNHGYVNGRVTSFQTVLQAGTAVLVDDKGEPVTKCYCGNPLTSPVAYPPVYFGPKWPSFNPNSLTVIIKNTTIIDIFTLVDPRTGESFRRPKGTDGTRDAPTTPPTTTPTLPPTTAPPRTQPPTTAAGPTPEQNAVAKLDRGAQQCQPFPAPIQDSTSRNVSTQPIDANHFTLRAVTRTVSGGMQVFTWSVDRGTLQFTPTNDLAQSASNHCPALR
jgi:hypothetical protein